ncbi:hypothetical protein GIW30_16330 [Pseudomonas sp. PA-5-4G]|nr:hypothetical protein [Pseudomonas sp. PA-5-4H]MCF5237081.1 hypothetical protein [Pseudomonas sp. PA-5-4G]MCF5248527.1 hypothetical protein [Pseudomonas sp. PA-5-4B]MCF5255996.1 hypothetical protein [Pseudomonas sp. PA-5-4B]MCF5261067.1 hypothetical protein [Pseudomonas sp. PA-5-4A]
MGVGPTLHECVVQGRPQPRPRRSVFLRQPGQRQHRPRHPRRHPLQQRTHHPKHR